MEKVFRIKENIFKIFKNYSTENDFFYLEHEFLTSLTSLKSINHQLSNIFELNGHNSNIVLKVLFCRDGCFWIFSLCLFIVSEQPISFIFLNSKKRILFVLKIFVHFPYYFVLFLTEWSFSKIVCSVKLN